MAPETGDREQRCVVLTPSAASTLSFGVAEVVRLQISSSELNSDDFSYPKIKP
jgi:hypothetical protein